MLLEPPRLWIELPPTGCQFHQYA